MIGPAPTWLAPIGDGQPAWCGLDSAWYLCAYPDAAEAVPGGQFAEVRRYHETQGERLGHAPNMFFDEAWYRLRHPEVAAAIADGTLRSGYAHYCATGHPTHSPHWLFDAAIYRQSLGTPAAGTSPSPGFANLYDHYLREGAAAGRSAHLLFDPAWYRAALADEPGADAAIAAFGAWPHFLRRVWFEQRDAPTSAFFDLDWFLEQHRLAAAMVVRREASCAVHAYMLGVARHGWDPVPQFSEAFYLAGHPDAAAALREGRCWAGYDHFLRIGASELRQPRAGIDLRRHAEGTPAAMSAPTGRDAFTRLLRHGNDAAAPPPVPPPPAPRSFSGGHVDSHGFAAPAEGWLFVGWLPGGARLQDGPATLEAGFEHGRIAGEGLVGCFPRADVPEAGFGIVVFLPGEAAAPGGLVSLTIATGDVRWRLLARVAEAGVEGAKMLASAAACLAPLPATPGNAALRSLLARRPYAGTNTLADLRDRMFLEIDEVVLCPPLVAGGAAGLVLCGWMLAGRGVVRRIRVHSGGRTAVVDLDRAVRLDRPDVLESIGSKHGLTELRSGLLAYVPDIVRGDEVPYLDVLTGRGELGYRSLPAPKLRGMEAIRFLLDRVELRYGEVAPAFDALFGPAVQRLNADRLAEPADRQTIDFGPPPAAPLLSVVVTLYGRLDFIEYQLAFLSRHAAAIPFELIYVLDDPPRRRQAEQLAASVHARFGMPFRLVLLARNLGYAPANNVGLEMARGTFVCFLNSDVFPGTADWMERLVQRLQETPRLGAVGPLLLFEDGCVQHQGMTFERLPAFADWHFPMHPGKGWRPTFARGLIPAVAITGACLVMPRALVQEMGGFDPGFAIGDFEDADLCLRLRARGLDCAVDAGVRLYHLERQSQAGSQHRWRMNLTLYNAWLHERRWGATLASLPASTPAGVEQAA